MSQASDRDLFARSLSGDFRSRVRLYKKFIHGNSRVRRLGAKYPGLDDFLHDCFTNVLRSRHPFEKSLRVSEHVESVAAWTALERERVRERLSSGVPSVIRMCAAVEGDEPAGRAQLTPYAPPRSGPEDSLPSRISAIVGEPQFTLTRALAMENTTWDSAAAFAGKPVNIIGPIVVRAVDRLSRYFGAPPPLNADLEPVLSEVSAEAAATRSTDPLKPKGRVIAMLLDSAFYSVTPEMRRIGLTVPSEVRTIALWDAARASTPPDEALRDHLDKCHYCSEVLRSLLRLQQALLSGANADFLLCPGASTLCQEPDDAEEGFDQHLDECAVCREERMRALWGEPVVTAGMKQARKIAWAVTAAVILAGVSVGGYRYFTTRNQIAAKATSPAVQAVPAAPPVEVNPKYAVLAEKVSLDDERVLASVFPKDQLAFIEARNDLRSGKSPETMLITQQLSNEFNDPGAQMLYAACLYARSVPDGYRAMQKSEAMPPRKPFRCWVTLQCALLVGDSATAAREVEHLSSDPEYAVRAKRILARMRAIP